MPEQASPQSPEPWTDDEEESWEDHTRRRVDQSLSALASPVRRFLLEMLVPGSAAAGDLAASASANFGISTSRASQHLQVLARAELVDVAVVGPRREYRLNDSGLSEVVAWVATLRPARGAGR